MSRLMTMPDVEGLTHLMELPAIVKDGEIIVAPRPEFIAPEGLVKLKALASNLGGEVVYVKVRAEIKNLEFSACLHQGCFNKANLLYCQSHDRSNRSITQPTMMLRPVRTHSS